MFGMYRVECHGTEGRLMRLALTSRGIGAWVNGFITAGAEASKGGNGKIQWVRI